MRFNCLNSQSNIREILHAFLASLHIFWCRPSSSTSPYLYGPFCEWCKLESARSTTLYKHTSRVPENPPFSHPSLADFLPLVMSRGRKIDFDWSGGSCRRVHGGSRQMRELVRTLFLRHVTCYGQEIVVSNGRGGLLSKISCLAPGPARHADQLRGREYSVI